MPYSPLCCTLHATKQVTQFFLSSVKEHYACLLFSVLRPTLRVEATVESRNDSAQYVARFHLRVLT